MKDDNVIIARRIITENRYLSLATSHGGQVWITPLAYVVDEEYNFYFYSALDSTHIQHIKYNPNVAFSIFNSTLPSDLVDGLQGSAIACQVDKKELPEIVDLYYSQVFTDPVVRSQWAQPVEHFMKDGFPFQRLFQIVPSEIFKLDTSTIEVDRRIEIKISELKREPAKFPTLAQIKAKKK